MAPALDILLVLMMALAVLGVAYVVHRLAFAGAEMRKLSGKMLVTCPETHKAAVVKVAMGRAALAAIAGKEGVQLSACTRWPEREGCDQACLAELLADPEKHSVWTIAAKWYQGKTCFFCGRPISEVSHLDHSPGLIGSDGKIIEWEKLRAEELPEQLASAQPVCWNCTITEGFRKEHPELVIDRPWKH
jgi:hypothetical protein